MKTSVEVVRMPAPYPKFWSVVIRSGCGQEVCLACNTEEGAKKILQAVNTYSHACDIYGDKD